MKKACVLNYSLAHLSVYIVFTCDYNIRHVQYVQILETPAAIFFYHRFPRKVSTYCVSTITYESGHSISFKITRSPSDVFFFFFFFFIFCSLIY